MSHARRQPVDEEAPGLARGDPDAPRGGQSRRLHPVHREDDPRVRLTPPFFRSRGAPPLSAHIWLK